MGHVDSHICLPDIAPQMDTKRFTIPDNYHLINVMVLDGIMAVSDQHGNLTKKMN